MFGIKELRQALTELTDQGKAILAKAESEGRDLTDEEKTQHDEILTKGAKVSEDIQRVEKQMDIERVAYGQAFDTRHPAEAHARTEDDPSGGFKTHTEFFEAVMDVGRGRVMDERLGRFRAAQGSDEQGSYSDPYGAFLIPTSVAPGIMSLTPEDDPIFDLTTKMPMRTPMVTINARVDKNHSTSVSGGLTVTRRPETVDGSSSRMQFAPVQFNAHELFGLAFATESILQDSPESFVALLNAGFRDEFASNAIAERLNGTGVGEPLGVLATGNSAKISVSKETGQAANTIVTENIDKMAARCWKFRRAIWMANQTTQPQLRALVRDVGTGGAPVAYFRPAETEGGADTLLGRPIFFTEHCATLGTVKDIFLCVWSEYIDGEYQPLRQAESIHVRFLSNERAFKFWKRNDGQPWWDTVLSPKNGDTLAPTITLATRS